MIRADYAEPILANPAPTGRDLRAFAGERSRNVRREPWVSAGAAPDVLASHSTSQTQSLRASRMPIAHADRRAPSPREHSRPWLVLVSAPFVAALTLTAVFIVARFAAMVAKTL
jgi:hypothetical protein